jgi:monofunctional glycosyltransferase
MRTTLRWSVSLAALLFAYLAYVYLTLPDVRPLARENPTTTAFIELRQREAEAMGKAFRVRQQWVPYGRISSHLKRAILVTEDAAFWQHDGLDYDEIRASIEVNLAEGRVVRGASTLTQQLAKNLYLSPSRNPVRKLREVAITRRLEAELGKQRIFEIYLNVIEWGDGIFGCEAAARAYYGKSAASLTAAESAMLAGAIINPRVHNPAAPTARLRARQQIILRRMGRGAAQNLPLPVLPEGGVPRENASGSATAVEEVVPPPLRPAS